MAILRSSGGAKTVRSSLPATTPHAAHIPRPLPHHHSSPAPQSHHSSSHSQLTYMNPSRDSCAHPQCTARRTDPSTANCPLHRCSHRPCDNTRQPDSTSLFCDQHTCDSTHCTAEVDGEGDTDDPSRSCEAHRRCAAQNCPRRCHVRDDALGLAMPTSLFCAAHCCRAEEGCDRQRAPQSRSWCSRHLCVERGCLGRRESGPVEAGRFCADHGCKSAGCAERRDVRVVGAEYCARHLCVVLGCARPGADGGVWCERHRYCDVEGCKRWIHVVAGVDGEVRYSQCEKRESFFSWFFSSSSLILPFHSRESFTCSPILAHSITFIVNTS